MCFFGCFFLKNKQKKHLFRDYCEKSENDVTYWHFNRLMSKS